MTTTTELWAGALAPESYVFEVTAEDAPGIDLETEVTGGELRVQDPAGQESTWTATHAFADGVLTLTHVFQETESELTKDGDWSVYAVLTLPTSSKRIRPRRLTVWPKYAVRP